ncbi:hypothetical protein KVR01_005057 [Diaporthe batatas]|uniref:uncharacterized protein n=1 Tax=Diaporthe batatas TaxID=748121 RepID=UPI001D04B809|nr:uncharacterized protein KVR01_005057 [Diaporthe batatas]KAG8164782.1 hypothetical protein KVR01_005057 [Diaporthe batatas]
MFSVSLLMTLGATAVAAVPSGARSLMSGSVKCPVVLEGRIPASAAPTDFDVNNDLFNSGYVKGNNLTWSDILLFPEVPNSRFDNASYKSVEVTISDESIFQKQYGFRRAGLQFANDTNEGSLGYQGLRTLHWSVKQDSARALNLSHEYLNVWHEAADYSRDQIMFQTGQMLAYPDMPADTFKFFDRNSKLLWSVPIDFTCWQNFAITLDIDSNLVQIYYSLGDAALKAVTGFVPADLSGEGQFQLGMIKKPTGTDDVVNSGFQESPLNEGQIYGGIFVEDSTGGCVSL